MRISLLQFAQALGICSGYLVGDLVFKYYGYRMVFAISIAVHVFAILYTIMKFPWDFKSQTSSGKGSIWTCVKDSMKKLKDSQHKGIIVSMCAAMIVCQAVKKADSSVTYLYTRHQYGWETDQYSVYAIIVVLCGAVGTSIIYPVLSYYLGVDDCVLGVVGSISCIDYHAVTGLATKDWHLYYAAGLGVLGISTNVTVRSILSKTSDSSTGGTLFSLFASIEALVPLITSPLIAFIYTSTLSIFPGTIFLVTAGLFFINIIIFSAIFVNKIKEKSRANTE